MKQADDLGVSQETIKNLRGLNSTYSEIDSLIENAEVGDLEKVLSEIESKISAVNEVITKFNEEYNKSSDSPQLCQPSG